MPVHIALVCRGRCRPSPDRVPLGATPDRDARGIVPGGLSVLVGEGLLPVLGAPLRGLTHTALDRGGLIVYGAIELSLMALLVHRTPASRNVGSTQERLTKVAA